MPTYREYKTKVLREAKECANRADPKGWSKLTPEQQAVAVYEKADDQYDNHSYEVTRLEQELAEARAEEEAACKVKNWAWKQLKERRAKKGG